MDLFEPDFAPGATPLATGTHFTVWSGAAQSIDVEIFAAESDMVVERQRLDAQQGGWHQGFVEGVQAGMRYGLRASGVFAPERGLWFDHGKLLVDPYAIEIDRPYTYDPRLAERGFDTAGLVPKARITTLPEPPYPAPPRFAAGGLIYEVNVRSFTMRHPDIPPARRGTLAALGHPSVLDHLKRIGVSAVELMPVVAWIDERHLPPLGLRNIWGYNPVTFMALDPRLAPGGLADLRHAVERLHAAGIGVILDLVFNHSGESDALGPTLSLRGLDGACYFRMREGQLVNDTGCGNTIRCEHPMARRLILDSLRHFAVNAGVDGFRFDLAPVLGREEHGFDPHAMLFRELLADPVLSDRILVAEPWDIGPDGYQLGHFAPPFLEWNDRYRDDVRRFWRGDPHMIGALATRLCGSADIFQTVRQASTRSVSFIAAHDGFTLADLVAYERRHNEANGEDNRDGHAENHSWNHGCEGPTDDPAIRAMRAADIRAMLSTLFATRGTIMLTAGDEFGRTQGGNNNAYAQDNETSWLDWEGRDELLIRFVAELAAMRARHPGLVDPRFLRDGDARWLKPSGEPFGIGDWDDPHSGAVAMVLPGICVLVNRGSDPVRFRVPGVDVPGRSVRFVERDIG